MRVIVTRPRDQAGPLVGRLEALGLEVVACPLIEIEPFDDPGRRRRLLVGDRHQPERRPRARRGGLGNHSRRSPRSDRARQRHCAALGVEPAFVPRESSQDGLLAEFPRPEGRILFAAAEGSRRRPIDELGADFVALYRTRLVRPKEPPAGDLVVLASGSAARSFAQLGTAVPAVSIGPQTTRVAESLGIDVVAEAETHDLDGLVAAVERVASGT